MFGTRVLAMDVGGGGKLTAYLAGGAETERTEETEETEIALSVVVRSGPGLRASKKTAGVVPPAA